MQVAALTAETISTNKKLANYKIETESVGEISFDWVRDKNSLIQWMDEDGYIMASGVGTSLCVVCSVRREAHWKLKRLSKITDHNVSTEVQR